MINPKILIVGSTGVLGKKLIKYLAKYNLKINTATCFNNNNLLLKLKKQFNIKKTFCINQSISDDHIRLKKYVKSNKFDIIYFLDTDLNSISILKESLKFQEKCVYAIANKELIIVGGKILLNSINKNNFFLPLDSEHFSLIDYINYDHNKIDKVYITASGGPFYFTNKNIKKVKFSEVIKHPKWKMGKDICINSSNFINKAFEILELSSIYNIPLSKIEILVSREALVHSVISFLDGRYVFNLFKNDMIIPLLKPLEGFIDPIIHKNKLKLDHYEKFKLLYLKQDKRFPLLKKIKMVKDFNHCQQILFLIINNKAQRLYLSNDIKYHQIVSYIFTNLFKFNYKFKLSNLDDIIEYYEYAKKKFN